MSKHLQIGDELLQEGRIKLHEGLREDEFQVVVIHRRTRQATHAVVVVVGEHTGRRAEKALGRPSDRQRLDQELKADLISFTSSSSSASGSDEARRDGCTTTTASSSSC